MKKLIPILLLIVTFASGQMVMTGSRQFIPGTGNAFQIPNSGSGTALNELAIGTGAPLTATTTTTSTTSGILGVVIAGSGNSGNAVIAMDGEALLAFDGATTAGDYVQQSTAYGGQGHDAGATCPASGQVVGQVLSTNASGGNYYILAGSRGCGSGSGSGGGWPATSGIPYFVQGQTAWNGTYSATAQIPATYIGTGTPSNATFLSGNGGNGTWTTPSVPVDAANVVTIPAADNVSLIVNGISGGGTSWLGTNTCSAGFTFAGWNLYASSLTYTPAGGCNTIYPGGVGTMLIPPNAFVLAYTKLPSTYMAVMPTLSSFADTSAGGLALTYNATTKVFGTIAVASGAMPNPAANGIPICTGSSCSTATILTVGTGLNLAGTTLTGTSGVPNPAANGMVECTGTLCSTSTTVALGTAVNNIPQLGAAGSLALTGNLTTNSASAICGSASPCLGFPLNTGPPTANASYSFFFGNSSYNCIEILNGTTNAGCLPVGPTSAPAASLAGWTGTGYGLGAAPAQYSKGSCTEVWSGTAASNVLQAGDDAISNNSCYNDSGVTRTITAVKCRSDYSSNGVTVNPSFGSAGTGTSICGGTLTCGNSYAYSASCSVSNASWTTGTGIDPVQASPDTHSTSIAMIVEYTY